MKKNCWKDNKEGHSVAAKKGWEIRRAKEIAKTLKGETDKISKVPKVPKVPKSVKADKVPKSVKADKVPKVPVPKAVSTKKRMIESFIKVTQKNDEIAVKIPHYYPELVSVAKNLGGKWDIDEWVYNSRIIDLVEKKYRELFGMWTSPYEAVDLILNLGTQNMGREYYVAGRLIAQRYSRDSHVKLGADIIVLEGGFPSWGGSVKNPRISQFGNLKVQLMDVPIEKAKELAVNNPFITVASPLKSNPIANLPVSTPQLRKLYTIARKKFGEDNVHTVQDAIRLMASAN